MRTKIRYHLTQSEWLTSKNKQTTGDGEDVEKGDPHVCLVGL